MARRQSEFYSGGQKKKRNLTIVPLILILFFVSVTVVLFYSTQKYAVITEDGVKVELPIMGGKEVITSTAGSDISEEDLGEPETVNASVTVDQPDYDIVLPTAGADVKSVRGIFIPYGDINSEAVEQYANRLSTGNALMFEVKTSNGYLQWYSDSSVAKSYGLNMNSTESTETLRSIVQACKDRGIYLVAKMSVCRDDIFATHSTNSILRDQYGGGLYDDAGYYLDPYNQLVRDYTVDQVRELWDIGFDEVALDNVIHPVLENESDENAISVMYTREMSATPTPVGAVCGFAYYVSQQLEDREDGKFLSIYVNGQTALYTADTSTGQDAGFFLKVYDRVYYDTDMYAYQYNVEDVKDFVYVGSYKDRFVPVVLNYLPDNTSWILVDYDEDDD